MQTLKNTKTIITTAALITALGVTLTACSTDIATPAPATPAATESVEPVETAPVTADATDGTDVPADQIEGLRAQGATVYTLTSGAGVVVTPGAELPDVVVEDAQSRVPAGGSQAAIGKVQTLRADLENEGIPAFVLYEVNGLDGALRYMVRPTFNVEGVSDYAAKIGGGKVDGWDAKDGAIAEMQGLMDQNPSAPLIDLAD